MHPTASTLPPATPMSTLRRESEQEGVPADVDAMSDSSGPIFINDGPIDIDGVTATAPTPQERLAELDVKVRAFVVQHPAAAVLGAITAGFVVGRLLSRR